MGDTSTTDTSTSTVDVTRLRTAARDVSEQARVVRSLVRTHVIEGVGALVLCGTLLHLVYNHGGVLVSANRTGVLLCATLILGYVVSRALWLHGPTRRPSAP